MGRISICPKTGLKRGAWTPEEDRLLAAYISRYGHWNWRELPKYAGLSRCGKSCRLRWKNYLHPHIKRGNYSKDEEELIMRMHQKLGNRWSAIAACLPGRTDNEIKNYWHTHLKKRTEESTSSNGGRQTLKKYETPENKAQVQNFIETIAPAILNLESAIVLPPSPQNAGDCSFSSADSDASMRPIPRDSSVLSFAESFLEGDLYVPEYPSPLFSLSPVNEFLHAYDMLDGYGMDVFPSLTSPYSNNHILDSWL